VRLVIHWTGRGTHKGKLGSIATTGKAVTVTGIDLVRISRKGSRELHKLGCARHVAAARHSTSRCRWGVIPLRKHHYEGFSTAAQVSVPDR
jgi:hypothetical protein